MRILLFVSTLVVFDLMLFCNVLQAQPQEWPTHRALLGNTGLVFTPTANIANDRQFSVGFGYIPERFSQLNNNDFKTGDKIWFVNMGFLPFLEISVRLSKPSGSGSIHGIGDRSIFLKVPILRERNDWRPALAIGIHDPFGNGNYHSNYLVATKHFQLNKDVVLLLNAGYGVAVLETFNEYLIGPFGGAAATWKFLTLEVEHDADRVNGALKVDLLNNHITLDLAMIGMRSVTGGVSAHFRL